MNLLETRRMLEHMADDAGVINGARKARYIFEHYTGLSSEDVYRMGDDYLLQGWKTAVLVRAVKRLISGVPVQLILGYTHFYADIFLCRKGVMIPRPETETLVDIAVAELDAMGGTRRILDLFTGSGIIAISLARARPGHRYFGADKSRKAINLARENSGRLGTDVEWRVGNMFAPFANEPEGFDIICANPPYIPASELKRLPLDVRTGDPMDALDGGKDGLRFHKRLAHEAGEWFKPGGRLIVEMGYDQRKAIGGLFKPRKVRFAKDLWGKDRVYVVSY